MVYFLKGNVSAGFWRLAAVRLMCCVLYCLLVKLNDVALPEQVISKLTRHHLPYGIKQCYLPPDTSELTHPA